MNARQMKLVWLAAALLVLLLACTRSVSTPPPASPVNISPDQPPAQIENTPEAETSQLQPKVGEPAYPAPLQTTSTPTFLASGVAGATAETPIILIPLAGPLSGREAEISGMAWHAGELILLPQYPSRFGDGLSGAVFALSQSDILAYLDGTLPGPLEPRPLAFIAPSIQDLLPGFEGFESIAIDGDRVYLTIDTRPGEMLGYLVSGLIAADNSVIALDQSPLTPIPPQTGIPNLSDEALLVFGNRLVSLYEANGAGVNPSPVAHLFDSGLQLQDSLSFPNIEYRITDATPPDGMGRFWAINYFYPGDMALQTDTDPLVAEYGEGASHAASQAVERLVQFQFSEDGIVLSETPPLQLVLTSNGEGRDWEAIAILHGRGFLLATDQHPETILAFVEYND